MKSSPEQPIAEDDSPLVLEAGAARLELVRVPAGECYLGSPPSEAGHEPTESPVRRVTISRPFYLGRHEVTQQQYEAVTGDRRGNVRGDLLPVTNVTFVEAVEFCRRLSAATGARVVLPTSAQWKYACRAGTTTRFSSGDNEAGLENIAWYRRNAYDGPHAVASKLPTRLASMTCWATSGSIAEMTSTSRRAPIENPIGKVVPRWGTMHGGGWLDDATVVRSANARATNDMFGGVGIRIAVDDAATPAN